MSQFAARMVALDMESIVLVAMICGLAFVIMKEMIPIPGLAIVSYPLLVLGSLSAQVLLRDSGFANGLGSAPFLALASGVGMIAVLIVIVIVVRIAMLMTDTVAPRPVIGPETRRE